MKNFWMIACLLVGSATFGDWSFAQQSDSSDAAARQKIMASDAWKQVMNEYQKWLNSQAIYTPDDIKRMSANLTAQMKTMSPDELQEFLNDWEAKLKVLNGKDFQDAQQWLGEYMSALSDGYRKRMLNNLGLTDITKLSAAQLDDAIVQIRADRLASEQSQAAFNRTRNQQVQSVQNANALTQQALAQESSDMRNRAGQFGAGNTVRNPYVPHSGPWDPQPALQTQFYVNGDGHVGYLLPF